MKCLTLNRVGYAFGVILIGLGTSHAGPVAPDSTDPLVAIDLNRNAIIADIVRGFESTEGDDAAASKLKVRLQKLRADRLLAASLASSRASLDSILAEGEASSSSAFAKVRQKALGDTTRDLLYTPIAPCRLVDTRGFDAPIQGGAFSPNERRSYEPQGRCSVPTANVASLMLSVTTQNLTPQSGGYLTILSPGSTVSVANDVFNLGASWSSLATTVMTGSAGQFDVFVNQANVHVVVDIVGYFGSPSSQIGSSQIADGAITAEKIAKGALPSATTGTFIVTGNRTTALPNGTAIATSPSCPVGSWVVSGACYSDGTTVHLTTFGFVVPNKWTCTFFNTGTYPVSVGANAHCIATPAAAK